MSGHTPTPWREGGDGNLRIYGPDGQGEHSGLIAEVFKGRGNVLLIVTAVNCHTDMLAALKSLLADIEDYQRINHLGGHDNHSQQMARAAIAKAEGR